ncbi:MAG: hypothetical protein ACFCGT_07085 [Sandaracinaceae bacterium]
MSERRYDPFTGRYVIVAPHRRSPRPLRPGGLPDPPGPCPFCPGNEAETEATVVAWPPAGPWRIRVVRNRYPLVTPDARPTPRGEATAGLHEVVIEGPDHDADLPEMSDDDLAALGRVWRDRVRDLAREPGIRAVTLFRNRGRRAGSSQPHPHSQLAALTWVPADVERRWALARAHAERTGRSLWATTLEHELAAGERVVEEGERFVMLCPFAPSRPGEVRLVPRDPEPPFGELPDDAAEELGRAVGDALRRLADRLAVTDSNVILRQPPAGARGPGAGWHLEVLPRTGGDAGFELATGVWVVVVSPEEAAGALRR